MIDKNKKIDILLSALQERYNAQHVIRKRVQEVGFWVLGILAAASGWVITNTCSISSKNGSLFILFSVLCYIVLKYHYLEDLKKGFSTQQRMTSKIEELLGFHESNFFTEDSLPLYPKSWKNAGTEEGEGKFFKTTYYLLYLGFGILIFSILFSI
jgi:hypothetical protein